VKSIWIIPVLVSILIIGSISLVYAITPSEVAKELGMPDITINPKSGPVGTVVTINVSELPMPPVGADPRLEFYMYLPGSDDYSPSLSDCDGYCLVLYSFDDIRNGKISPKEITFALPSVRNPGPTSVQLSIPFNESGVKQGAVVSSVCDVVINGEIVYRFGYSCSNYDVPIGEYEIGFGWAIAIGDVYDKRQTITFTVTDEPYQFKGTSNDSIVISPEDYVRGSSDLILKKFERDEMTKTEFIAALENQGWTTDDIRGAIAIVGKLEHQQELFADETSEENAVIPEFGTMSMMDDVELMVAITDSVMGDGTHVYLEFSEIHVNYQITAMQNDEEIFTMTDHAMEMTGANHHIDAVGTVENPIDIEIVSLGIGAPGANQDWTGPTGTVATTQVVPEFGTIAMMVLAVAIISIVAVTAKSRVVPRF